MTSIYETIYCKQNKIFNFESHFNRLLKSAKILNLPTNFTRQNLEQKILTKLQKSNYPETRVKITLSQNKLSITCFSITNSQLPHKLITFQGTRPHPHLKLTDRKTENQALSKAHKSNAIDALLVNEHGYITEGSISNFFVIKNDTLITPKDNILKGTFRQIILDSAKKLKIPIKLQPIHLNDLPTIEGAFITNAIKKIVPIYQIDKITIPKSNITELLIQDFQRPSKTLQ